MIGPGMSAMQRATARPTRAPQPPQDAPSPTLAAGDQPAAPEPAQALSAVPAWLRCPNEPPCPHTGLLHDIDDYDDPNPRCCVEGCDCGKGERQNATQGNEGEQ